MKSYGLCLLGLMLFSSMGTALTSHEISQNLSSRLHTLPQGGKLIKSYTNHSQSYIYDQALAIIAFSKSNKRNEARSLLVALSKLQHADGSLYFSYDLDGKSPYPQAGDARFAGAIAWVALAATTYQFHFQSTEFLRFNTQILSYLSHQMQAVTIQGTKSLAVKFNPTNLKDTSWDESNVAALEHNLDAYAAISQFEKINPNPQWKMVGKKIETFILSMWDKKRGHFWSGVNLDNGEINKDEVYLDNQSWGLLALEDKAFKKLATKSALDFNCEQFLVEHAGVKGFMDTRPVRGPAAQSFVWSEGTAGQVLAMERHHKTKQDKTCELIDRKELVGSLAKMRQVDGGIAYSTAINNPNFSHASSVAGTVWFYFVARGINPFHI